jgi:hypothetical protein
LTHSTKHHGNSFSNSIGAWDNENTYSPVLKKASDIPGGKDYAGRLLWAEYFGSYLAPKTYPDSRDSWLNLCFHITGPTLIPPRKWGMELQAILSDIEHKAFFAKNPKCCQAAKSLTVGWLLLSSKTISEETFLPSLRAKLQLPPEVAVGLQFRPILLPNGKHPPYDKDAPAPIALHLEIDELYFGRYKKAIAKIFRSGSSASINGLTLRLVPCF